jgi:hypothetical protein
VSVEEWLVEAEGRSYGFHYAVLRSKDTGEYVGSTDGTKKALRKYLAALHINSNESYIKLKNLL